MAEHQIVDLAVAGSNPASHPFFLRSEARDTTNCARMAQKIAGIRPFVPEWRNHLLEVGDDFGLGPNIDSESVSMTQARHFCSVQPCSASIDRYRPTLSSTSRIVVASSGLRPERSGRFRFRLSTTTRKPSRRNRSLNTWKLAISGSSPSASKTVARGTTRRRISILALTKIASARL